MDAVQSDLTEPSPAHVRHARLALAGLLGFLGLYFGLLAWFAWRAHVLFANGTCDVQAGFASLAYLLLAIFLVKALFFIKRSKTPPMVEITAGSEPQLFEFLDRLIARVGAPKPHRVFLSHEVNAAVFYDLSLINLVWPTRKNLVIGIGLVNVLSMGELEAVLAHEFGHFTQRSTRVGRWVLFGQQIARQIVGRRDGFDRALYGLSSMPMGVGEWVLMPLFLIIRLFAWLVRITVWSVRTTMEMASSVVVFAERALSREREVHADLVAVSLTGSDALIHALHRIGPAEDAMSEALVLTGEALDRGSAVPDLYALQTRAIVRMRAILGDPGFGLPPPRPAGDRAGHRVFEHARAQPPAMWATHPSNREREDHAKAIYIEREIDERPAWVIFRDPAATRRQMTQHFFTSHGVELAKTTSLTDVEALALVDRHFDRKYFDGRYRGVYLGRSCVREAAQVDRLFEPLPSAELDFASLYPESLRHDLARWRDLKVERASLEGLREGRLETPDGVIWHRGRAIRPREIPGALQQIDADLRLARETLAAHDRVYRSVHAVGARRLGEDWAAYHSSLIALLHYADHTEANLRDARRHLATILNSVTGRLTEAEQHRLMQAAGDLHDSIAKVHKQAGKIVLPEAVACEFGGREWKEQLGERFDFDLPEGANIGAWLAVIDGWLDAVLGPLDALERQCLQVMLEVEAEIESCIGEGRHPGPAPTPAKLPSDYKVLPPGKERELETKPGLWTRFHLAEGRLPAAARTVIALGIVGVVVYVGLYAGG